MENKKRLIIITAVVIILILAFALIVNKLAQAPEVAIPPVNPISNTQLEPQITPEKDEEILPTVEMGNSIGTVEEITASSLTLKTEGGKTLTLTINKTPNVFAFTSKGSEEKKISDVKASSKISVQYSTENVVKSMYLMK